MAFEVSVVVLSASADDDDPGAEALENISHRGRNSAVSEYQRLFSVGVDVVSAQHMLKAEDIGVVAVYLFAAAHKGVDAAGAFCRGRELVAKREDRLFIGDGHVQSVPVAAFDEPFKLVGGKLIQPVFIIREHSVDLRRIAVTELFSDKSAPEHYITSL